MEAGREWRRRSAEARGENEARSIGEREVIGEDIPEEGGESHGGRDGAAEDGGGETTEVRVASEVAALLPRRTARRATTPVEGVSGGAATARDHSDNCLKSPDPAIVVPKAHDRRVRRRAMNSW
jgi:hypothetical protein